MELTVEIERVRLSGLASGGPSGAAPPANDATTGDEINRRQAALKAVAASLKKGDIEKLLDGAEAITLRISTGTPIRI